VARPSRRSRGVSVSVSVSKSATRTFGRRPSTPPYSCGHTALQP
jgi:hypothetical protein